MAKVYLHGGHLIEVTQTRQQVIDAVAAQVVDGRSIPPMSIVTGTLPASAGSITIYTRQILGVSD